MYKSLIMHINNCVIYVTYESMLTHTFQKKKCSKRKKNIWEMNILVKCLTETCIADESEGSMDLFHKMYWSIGSVCWGAQSSH